MSDGDALVNHFVVVIGQMPTPVIRRVRTVLDATQDWDGAASRDLWSSPGGRVHIAPPRRVDVAAAVGFGDTSAAVAGQPIADGITTSVLERRLASDWASFEPGDLSARVDGMFAAVWIGPDGRGWIASDAFGLFPLYVGESRGVTIVATRARLVAACIDAIETGMPNHDRLTSVDVATIGYAVGDRSGYERIRRVPFRASVRIDRGVAEIVTTVDNPFAVDVVDEAQHDDVVDRVEAAGIRILRNATGSTACRPIATLTGGRDTRLVLALIARAGMLDSFRFLTLGGPHLPDVQVAGAIADRLELAWDIRSQGQDTPSEHSGFLDRVARVDGEFGFGRVDRDRDDELRFSGFVGESLCSHTPRTRPDSFTRAVGTILKRTGTGRDLVRPSAVEGVRERTVALLERIDRAGCRSEDLPDAYYVVQRLRRWIGSRPERWERVVFPLYSPDAIRAAFSLGAHARHQRVIHDTIIARAGLGLDEIPYTKMLTADRSLPTPRRAPAPRSTPKPAAAPAASAADVYRSVLGATGNKSADAELDVERIERACRSIEILDRPGKRNLVDALTALVWMSDVTAGVRHQR